MPRQSRATYFLGAEWTGDEVRLALVEQAEGGLVLHSTQTVRAGEELARALRALPRRPQAVACAVSLEHAAIRTLNLPPTAEENLERVVTLEAESALPLQSEELALSYHVLGMTEQSRLEVLLAAARQKAVQEHLGRVNAAPWVSAAVTVTAVALLNAVQQTAPPGKGAVAILRIEEGSSELVVAERGRLLVAQSIPIGCRGAAPAPEPVRAAVPVAAGAGGEEPVGVLSPEAHPWIAPVSQQVRYALQALAYERGLSVERLYVCGKGAALAGVEWHLGEQLHLPVATLAPAARREGSNGCSPSNAGVYAVAYGCAVQAAGAAAIPLNLTPARVAVAREIEQRRQTRFSWSALAGSVLLSAALVFAAAMHHRRQTLALVTARLRELEAIAQKPAASPEQLEAAEKAIAAAVETRVSAATMLSMLSRHLPEGTWLAELSYNAQTGAVVRGYAMDAAGAQRAQIALLRQRLFDEVTLDHLANERIGAVPVWGFQLTCRLRSEGETARRGSRR